MRADMAYRMSCRARSEWLWGGLILKNCRSRSSPEISCWRVGEGVVIRQQSKIQIAGRTVPMHPLAFLLFYHEVRKDQGVYSDCDVLSGVRLLFFINNLTVFRRAQYFSMRSKQRRTYKTDRSPLTPTPHHFMPDQPSSPSSRLPRGSHSPGQGSIRGGQTRLQALQRQNNELRREIVQLKVQQFYHFDDGKLKSLIQELQALRKEVRKQEQIVADLQTQNDFLRRTNAQLKLQFEKEVSGRTRDAYAQELSRNNGQGQGPSRAALSRALEDELTHLASCSHFNSTTLTLDDQDYRASPTPTPPEGAKDSRSSRKHLVEKCLSPRRGKESQSANEYLLYRRGKEGREGREGRQRNILQRLAE